ncbi:hypothetical protein H072_10927 [Dactylellina haptotyla CBS 200.50]|uniref:Trafficking protein particle complex subunit 11 domain-containing protein n=1 Tax=Dactylellina haptotyla (strain CBS 200.50) TaxID=1284197 RepID=S8B991_DACHA|nr:hypothetical protein H072_10927 [Dactylellina haptotyla CBS 200.50]
MDAVVSRVAADNSNSKVTVTFWDPSAVYPLFSPDIRSRLPLRNLHWKSPSRPLRSINSLYVEFLPALPPSNGVATEDAPFTRNTTSLYGVPEGSPSRNTSIDGVSPLPTSLPTSPPKVRGGSIGRRRSSTPNLNTYIRRTTLADIPMKERRHQIPGLRQTSYLKIFFLRCDDNDYYKNTAKKELKEWVAANCNQPSTSSSSSSSAGKNDFHDYFEWMIVHVVLPGTPAAAQPRLNGQSSSSLNSAASSEPKSRFQFKSSTTILEKLRSDFGSTSKKALPRVVQIRLSHPQPSPPPGAPAPATPLPTPAEKEADYAVLISHMKSLILTSFDLRVQQYEDDILARSNQQHMPGWNFCTFFVLKEGLAGAFESVGLIEDAWAIYQELAVAGEGIIVGEEVDREGGKTFLGWSGEIVKTLVEEGRRWNIHTSNRFKSHSSSSLTVPGTPVTPGTPPLTEFGETASERDDPHVTILSANRKPYRELILSNNISVFDFLSYCFARQASLLLRLAATLPPKAPGGAHPATGDASYSFFDPTSTPEESATASSTSREGEAGYLTEVVKKGIEFLRTGSAVLRAELYRGWESMQADLELIKKSEAESAEEQGIDPKSPDGDDRPQPGEDKFDLTFPAAKAFIDHYVASFVVNGVMQLIDATDHKSVPHLDWKDLLLSEAKSPPPTPSITQGFEGGGMIKPDTKDMPPDAIPQRSTTIYSTDTDDKKGPSVSEGSSAMEELAFFRAEALMLARGVVVEIAGNRWRSSQEKLHPAPKHQEASAPDLGMVNVSLNDAAGERSPTSTQKSEETLEKDDWLWLWGIRAGMLRHALLSDTGFLSVYERMTETIVKLFSLAKRVKSTERTLAEIACIKYYRKDYAAAANYFSKLAPSYTMHGWAVVEENLLMMYADCLKKMGRDEEFGKVILVLLKKRADQEKRRWRTQRTSMLFLNGVIRIDGDEGLGTLPGMDEVSKVVIPTDLRFDEFFTDIDVETCPHFEGEDAGKGGFKWSVIVHCRWLLNHSVSINNGTMKISIADERVKGIAGIAKDVELVTEGDNIVKRGRNKIEFVSDTFYAGVYEILCLEIVINNITFKHKFKPDPPQMVDGVPPPPQRRIEVPKVILFQAPDTFHIALNSPMFIQLDKLRTIELEINAGNTVVERVEMKIKSLTAGLRLLVGDIQIVNGAGEKAHLEDATLEFDENSLIKLGSKSADNRLRHVMLRIPYKSESDLHEISVRLEAHLTTSTYDYKYVATPFTPVALPLSVNVQDIFTRAALFSKFQVSTVNHIPLRIVRAGLDGSKAFNTSTGIGCSDIDDDGTVVYTKQPANFTFKTTRVPRQEEFSGENLYLKVMWRGVGDEISAAVKSAFIAHISAAGYGRYQRLFMPTVEAILDSLDQTDIERAVLLNAIRLPPYAPEAWTDAFFGVNTKKTGERETVAKVVEEFFKMWSGKRRVPLLAPVKAFGKGISGTPEEKEELETRLNDITRTIVIPVEIPALQCLATAKLDLLGIPNRGVNGPKMVRVGEVIKATLKIGISRCWDLGKDRERRSANVPESLRFYYEMSTSHNLESSRRDKNDDWLINGRRRGVFEYSFERDCTEDSEDKEVQFELLLVPLKSGFLLLPGIDVRALPYIPVNNNSAAPATGDDDDNFTVTCETDYRSASEGVLVVSEVEEKVVKVDEMGTLGRMGGAGSIRRPTSAGVIVSSPPHEGQVTA